jgi:hypothetical protein
MCYSSHGLLPARQRVLRAGDVAQLMRCRQSLLAQGARVSLSCGSSAVLVFLRPCQEARRDNVSPD